MKKLDVITRAALLACCAVVNLCKKIGVDPQWMLYAVKAEMEKNQ